MYERSASVLERYFDKKIGFDKEQNLKTNLENFKYLFEEIEKYQSVVMEEEKVIEEFDKLASKIQQIQRTQGDLYNSNLKLEQERYEIFNNLEFTSEESEKSLNRIEKQVDFNNNQIKELKQEFILTYTLFEEKQKERNRCTKNRRILEKKHFETIDDSNAQLEDLNSEEINDLKILLREEQEDLLKQEILKIMLDNGKGEKIPFNKNVIENAVNARTKIAKEELDCYLLAYDKNRKLLSEVKNDSIGLEKYKKVIDDIGLKLEFLNAEKRYIVDFLDNERMTVINGEKAHNKLMKEACDNFELDIAQINNLYKLILKEIAGKATKKAYRELYNKTYLKDIEEKERNFEKEINNINIRMGTIINSNYWRIEGIKNIYEVFQNEVSRVFEKDLSEFKLEEVYEEEPQDTNNTEVEEKIQETNNIELEEQIEQTNNIEFEEEREENDNIEEFEDEEKISNTDIEEAIKEMDMENKLDSIELVDDDLEYYDEEYNDKNKDNDYDEDDEYDDEIEEDEYDDDNDEYDEYEDDEYDDDNEEDEYEEDEDNLDNEYEDDEYNDDNEDDEYDDEEYDDDNEDDEYEDDDEYDDDNNEDDEIEEDEDDEYEDDNLDEEYDDDNEEDKYNDDEYDTDNENEEYDNSEDDKKKDKVHNKKNKEDDSHKHEKANNNELEEFFNEKFEDDEEDDDLEGFLDTEYDQDDEEEEYDEDNDDDSEEFYDEEYEEDDEIEALLRQINQDIDSEDDKKSNNLKKQKAKSEGKHRQQKEDNGIFNKIFKDKKKK